jgi:hypothetical protein
MSSTIDPKAGGGTQSNSREDGSQPDKCQAATTAISDAEQPAKSGPEFVDGTRPESPKMRVLYRIQTNDRELRSVSQTCLAALHQFNDHLPRLFVYGGIMSEIVGDGRGNATIRAVSTAALRGYLTRSADFFRITTDGTVRVSPPKDAVEDLLALNADKLDFPQLAAMTQAPALRPDGSILNRQGYDPDLELYYAPRRGFTMRDVPESPNANQVREAVDAIDDVICDFPFVDDASRANAIGMLLTPIVRELIADNVPMACVDANHPGAGKGLLVDVLSLIATGSRANMSPMPANSGHNNYAEEEMRKRLTSAFAAGRALLVWDNVKQIIDSPNLASALTCEYWSDRILGHTRELNVRPRTVFVATGNNMSVSNEIARRCYWVRMESATSQPWMGRTFRHPKLLHYVRTKRAELLRALLILGSAWLKRGSPEPDTPIIGSFEDWCTVIGGILQNAGIQGFLGNLEEFHAKANPTEVSWESFFLLVDSVFSGKKFTAFELAGRVRTSEGLREVLPNEFSEALADQTGDSLQRALGNAFREKVDMRFGPDNIRVEKGGVTRNKVIEWVIRRG